MSHYRAHRNLSDRAAVERQNAGSSLNQTTIDGAQRDMKHVEGSRQRQMLKDRLPIKTYIRK